MTYSLTIEHSNSDPTYVNDIKTWPTVTNYLRNKLDQWTTRVHIYKWSSNHKCLGEKCVTMGNLCEVAFALRDKILL
jgi:hypothetical protein